MTTLLDEIIAHKRVEVAAAKAERSADALERAADAAVSPLRGFRAAVGEGEAPRVIAEVKRRSPSKGPIRPDLDPVDCARAYATGGAVAISVLTDHKYFGGELGYLGKIREDVDLPLLRKDFVIDPYQIDEARVAGADAVLLIVAALAREELEDLSRRARTRGLDILVEVHEESELETALAAGADLIGINNRNLHTFEVDLATTERLAPQIPAGVVVVAESGIFTSGDVRRLERAGAHAFLVGESLMRAPDVGEALVRLRGIS